MKQSDVRQGEGETQRENFNRLMKAFIEDYQKAFAVTFNPTIHSGYFNHSA